jgi:SSS family solute:Na+ symporter
VIISAVIVLAYTVLGGFVAVSITDMLQAFFMLFGLVVLPIVALISFGGLSNLYNAIVGAKGFPMVDPLALGFGGMVGYLGIGLGSPGNPHILVRYMSIKDPKLLRKAALIGTVWNVIMAWGAIFIGLVAKAQLETGMVAGDVFSDPEKIFPCMAAQLMHPFILGLMIASVFAAIMSTVDSQLLVASSAISRDIYQKVIKGGSEVAEKHMVFISRIIILGMVIFATIIGIIAIKYPDAKNLVFWLVLFAWGGMGASFGTTLLLALFWKGTTKWGVFAGLISGTVITIIWKTLRTMPEYKSLIYELIPAFSISFVLVILVSIFTKPPEGAEQELMEISSKY